MKKLAVYVLVLWIGIISPEIFAEPGMGCIEKENGEDISFEEAQEVFDRLLYPEKYKDKTDVHVEYKSVILKWLKHRYV